MDSVPPPCQIFSIVNESGLAPIKGDVRSDRSVDRACHFGPRVIERSDFPHGSVSTRPSFYEAYAPFERYPA